MRALHLPLGKSFLTQHAVFTSLRKPLKEKQGRQRSRSPSVSQELRVLTQRCTKMDTALNVGASQLPNFLNTTKTNMVLGDMFYIRPENSDKYQHYLGSILFTSIFPLFLRFYFLLQPSSKVKMSLHNILLHRNPEKHYPNNKITLQ